MPINLPNGANVEEIVLPDGSQASEVIGPNGSTVWERVTIPDSADLQVHYDPSEINDVSSTYTAEVGPDLPASGSPSIITGAKNGLNVVEYDGSSDSHEADFGSVVSQPVHFFFVFKFESTTAGEYETFFSGTTEDFRAEKSGFGDDDWRARAGSNLLGGASDTDWHIMTVLFDGGGSHMRIDGVEVASSGVGSNDWTGVAFGYYAPGSDQYANVRMGEVLGYSADRTDVEADTESYLSDKWGIPI